MAVHAKYGKSQDETSCVHRVTRPTVKRKSHTSFTGFLNSHMVRSVQKYEVHSTFVSTVPDICENETKHGLGVQGGMDRNKWPFRPQNTAE